MNDQLLAEHRLIREFTRQFENASELRALLTVLAEARPTLVAHFATEEEDEGFYDRVRSMAPNCIERVDRLEREHQAFLKDLDALVARSQACLAGPVAEILGDARLLAQRLRRHEVAEDEIVVDTLYGDLGQGD
jgi:hemerythrin-like domain-containing protein